MADLPSIPGGEEQLVADEDSRKPDKAPPAAMPGKAEIDPGGIPASGFPGADPAGDYPDPKGPGFPAVDQQEDYRRNKAVGKDRKKHRPREGKHQFMPEGTPDEGKNPDDQDIHSEGAGNGKYPQGETLTGKIRPF
jgi:hypothetical protein